MAAPLRLKATGASPGVASGPAYIAEPLAAAASLPSSVSDHAELADAIKTAIRELQDLATGTDPESRDIIEFQIEVLQDPTLAEMADARIDQGENVAFAWVGTLDGYIRELECSAEDQLRARAVDILDIKNRVLSVLTGTPVDDFPAGSIYVGKDMEPSRFLAHDWSAGGGIALYAGSAVGHVALLARSRSVPMVIGAGRFATEAGQHIGVDGDSGLVILQTAKEMATPAQFDHPVTSTVSTVDNGDLRTADGSQVLLSINVNAPDDVDAIPAATTAGIGLMRSEFAVMSLGDAANEEKQFAIYRRLLDWADGRSVTIRMLDIGGDKPLSGLTEMSSLRGIRLLLARPEIARVQARALLRAAVFGNLRIMLPMVTVPSDVEDIRQIYREESSELARRGMLNRIPPIGMMVEVPAAALMLDAFESADFFSFGTNDLAQYLVASPREDADFALYQAQAVPALLRLLTQAVKLAGGKPLSICGDMAADPSRTADLLAAGIRHFSVAPARLPAIRSAIVGLNADGTKAAGE
ncbi:phosphoenolpyruvate-protein kinase (PTS system EI component) [Rhizobium sp. CF122]|uniref:putative PEP-binding protein n=1 Tax=Rhizobium sp. CF122 TaxID=1144312 RepID=UPI0002719801|nr:putative PEP-binding protein [Rhizobium sp. CF122]EJL52849.1 phosphoenolpyruvate-protein kinase (PTS system EI component) [Rhizobium sp. CF122]